MPAIRDEQQLDLVESLQNYLPFLPFSAALDPYRDLFTRLGFFRAPVVPPLADSTRRGDAIPVYLHDQGLKFLRDLSRRVGEENEYAVGALENRVSFICGAGFKYKVEGVADGVPEWLIKRGQRIVDQFLADAEFGELEQELVRRGDVDGEWFLRCFYRTDGSTEVRIVEPEHVQTPPSHANSIGHLFGVETAPSDIETPVAYWIYDDPLRRTMCRVPATEIVHAKCNGRRTWKRGLPVFYSVTENLVRVERCLRNFAVMSQTVATYSVIRKHKGSSSSAVQAFREQLAATKITDPITGDDRNLEQALPGGTHDVPANVDIEFPGSQVNVGGYVQTLQADLRAIGSRMVMPEYMISGDASNANYSSTMVAESPAVRKFERDQAFYAGKFASAGGRKPSVLRRVLLNAERCGLLPRGACRLLKVTAEGPQLTVRNKGEETNRNKTLVDGGVMSPATWAQSEGLDYEAEKRQGAGRQQKQQSHQPGKQPGEGGGLSGMMAAAQEDWPDRDGDEALPEDEAVVRMLAEAFELRPVWDPFDLDHDEPGMVLSEAKGGKSAVEEEPEEAAGMMADILFGVFGKKALAALSGGVVEAKGSWNELDHPRGKDGRFIPKGSAEARSAALEAVRRLKGRPATAKNVRSLASHLAILNVKQLKALHKEHGVKAPGRLRQQLIDSLMQQLPGKGDGDGGGGKGAGGAATRPGGDVEKTPGGHGDAGGGRGGPDGGEPSGAGPSRRVPASREEVSRRLDRLSEFFRKKGQHQVADWMGKLRDHVNAVGTEEALASLGPEGGRADDEKTQYEGGWDTMGHFAEAYLNRHGIVPLFSGDVVDPDKRIVSSMSADQGAVSPDPYAVGDFHPRDPNFKDKLEEAKHLPGLESSEDIDVITGKRVTHLTPEVMAKMDERYGKGQWIIKAYGDEAAAGYGIYFPQRAEQIRLDAQSTIWTAGEHLARYGFRIGRHPDTGKAIGLVHETGDLYQFGTEEYDRAIYGDARQWADRVAAAADNEAGAMLPGGGKEFMAQPAFKAVGVSDADRAAGKTIAPGEGRVHIVTRNGKAEIVPHSTWIKGEHLPVVFETEDTRAMAQAALDAINKLPESERNGQIYAPDILKAEGGYRVVEANPANKTGSSGYLGDNPFIIDAYVSHLTGREPAHTRFIRGILTRRKRAKESIGAAAADDDPEEAAGLIADIMPGRIGESAGCGSDCECADCSLRRLLEKKKDKTGRCHDDKGHWVDCDDPRAVGSGKESKGKAVAEVVKRMRAAAKAHPKGTMWGGNESQEVITDAIGFANLGLGGKPGYDGEAELSQLIGPEAEQHGNPKILIDAKKSEGMKYAERGRVNKAAHYRREAKSGDVIMGDVVVTPEGVYLHLGLDSRQTVVFGATGRPVVSADELAEYVNGSGEDLPVVKLLSVKGMEGLAGLDEKGIEKLRKKLGDSIRAVIEGAGMAKVKRHLNKMAENALIQNGREAAGDDLGAKGIAKGLAEDEANVERLVKHLDPRTRELLLAKLKGKS